GWLHAVAYHVSCKARARAARRRALEARVAPAPAAEAPPDPTVRELLAAVHEGRNRPPGQDRPPPVLCHLPERTQDATPRQRGCTEGVLRGRLNRGRARLRARLVRRGLDLPAGLSAFLLAHGLASAVPAALAEAALRCAVGSVPARVAALAEAGL